MKINANYQNLKESYLFSTIARKLKEYQMENPQARIIRLGIGDVTLPLCGAVIQALHSAADEMAQSDTFQGYGPEQGYDFLRQAICGYYAERGIDLEPNELFVGDGAKSDVGNILDIFDTDNTVLVTDPVYPVYVDTNLMAGRRILYLDANEQNGFLPLPDEALSADLIYLCSPNNPTGASYNREQLKKWVDYALEHNAVLLFDAAYEAFVQEDLPRSIYQISGAKECAIEFCSFSKMAGFTGTRCGWTVVPKALKRQGIELRKLWLRRQTTKFNGVSYIVQRGAAAVFSEKGKRQIKESLAYYLENGRLISQTLNNLGVWYTGGRNSPYIWLKCPAGLDSWKFFNRLLSEAHIVGTPGAGFGRNGKDFFRLTSFSTHTSTVQAMEFFSDFYKKNGYCKG